MQFGKANQLAIERVQRMSRKWAANAAFWRVDERQQRAEHIAGSLVGEMTMDLLDLGELVTPALQGEIVPLGRYQFLGRLLRLLVQGSNSIETLRSVENEFELSTCSST